MRLSLVLPWEMVPDWLTGGAFGAEGSIITTLGSSCIPSDCLSLWGEERKV